MPITALVSFTLSVTIFIISLLMRVAGKLRFGIPLAYFFIIAFFPPANQWASSHEASALAILYVLVATTIVSWLISLYRYIKGKTSDSNRESDIAWQIRRAREMGINLNKIQFNKQGDLLNPQTGEPIVFGEGVTFYKI